MWWTFFAAVAPKQPGFLGLPPWVADLGPTGATAALAYGILHLLVKYLNKREDAHREERKEVVGQLAALAKGQDETQKEAIQVMTKMVSLVERTERAERVERAERTRKSNKPGDSEERHGLK